jgi:hypothetical protein
VREEEKEKEMRGNFKSTWLQATGGRKRKEEEEELRGKNRTTWHLVTWSADKRGWKGVEGRGRRRRKWKESTVKHWRAEGSEGEGDRKQEAGSRMREEGRGGEIERKEM